MKRLFDLTVPASPLGPRGDRRGGGLRGLRVAPVARHPFLRAVGHRLPGCGRTTSTTFQELAERIQGYIRDKMPEWKREYEGVENMTLAVMGCVVNGPGESKAASIGISLPGTGEEPHCPVYIDGQHFTTLKGTYEELAHAFRALVDDYIATKYPKRQPAPVPTVQ